jgi:hypothetical protein
LPPVVAQGDLALRVRTQPGQLAGLAQLRLALHQPVRVVDRRRHQHLGLVARVAEHQALVAGALLLVLALVHAHGDIPGLLADGVEHGAGGAVEADVRAGVADIRDHVAHDFLEVDIGAGRHLAGNDDHAGLDHGFHGDAGLPVVLQDVVEDGIGDLVGHLVRVSLGHGFGGENRVLAHACSLLDG